jgi:hypothetical protein
LREISRLAGSSDRLRPAAKWCTTLGSVCATPPRLSVRNKCPNVERRFASKSSTSRVEPNCLLNDLRQEPVTGVADLHYSQWPSRHHEFNKSWSTRPSRRGRRSGDFPAASRRTLLTSARICDGIGYPHARIGVTKPPDSEMRKIHSLAAGLSKALSSHDSYLSTANSFEKGMERNYDSENRRHVKLPLSPPLLGACDYAMASNGLGPAIDTLQELFGASNRADR